MPIGGRRELRAEIREHRSTALEATDGSADRERGGRRRWGLIVIDDRHRRLTLPAERRALGVGQGHREALRAFRRQVLADRDLHQPWRGVSILKPDKRPGRREILTRARRAATRGDRDAGGPARAALRVTSTSAVPLASPTANAGLLSWIVPACGCDPVEHCAGGRGRTGGSGICVAARGLRPRALSRGPAWCGSMMNATAPDLWPRSSIASASRVTFTTNCCPA